MKTRVLDCWAILEWISERHGAGRTVAAILSQAEAGQTRLLMSAINAGEVYYFLLKDHKRTLAENWRRTSGALPITIETPTLEDIWEAAVLKGGFRISYADAFAAALARKHSCPLVTGDPEFRSVDDLELHWIGR